jgi:hypothetical protein
MAAVFKAVTHVPSKKSNAANSSFRRVDASSPAQPSAQRTSPGLFVYLNA